MQKIAADQRLVRHYIRAYRLVAIYCGISRAGKTIVGRCHNLEAKLTELTAAHGKISTYGIWWVADGAKADLLLSQVPRGMGAAAICEELPIFAAAERLSLTTDADVRARAAAGIEALQLREQLTLRRLNASYRETRLQRAAAGFKTPTYNAFMAHELGRLIYAEAGRFFGRSASRPRRAAGH